MNAQQAQLKERLQRIAKSRESYAACHPRGKADLLAHFTSGWNPRSQDGTRWLEHASKSGVRFVGFSDEIARRAVQHDGWYCDSFASDVYRGCVLQIPARNGRPLFFSAYADPWNKDCYCVDMRGDFIGDDSEGADAKHDAALRADDFAKYHAEEARDYDSAWQDGSRYASLGEEIAADKLSIKALAAEVRAAGKSFPPEICATLRARVRSLRADMQKAREEREKMLSDNCYRGKYADAFNDGAGAKIV